MCIPVAKEHHLGCDGSISPYRENPVPGRNLPRFLAFVNDSGATRDVYSRINIRKARGLPLDLEVDRLQVCPGLQGRRQGYASTAVRKSKLRLHRHRISLTRDGVGFLSDELLELMQPEDAGLDYVLAWDAALGRFCRIDQQQREAENCDRGNSPEHGHARAAVVSAATSATTRAASV